MSNRRSSSDHGRGAPDPGGLSDDAKIACVIAGGVGLGLAAYWLFGDSNESERLVTFSVVRLDSYVIKGLLRIVAAP